jgi:glycosyltransferase involved in cell wall biosynthesis
MKLLLSVYACEPNRGSEEGCGWNYVQHYAKLGYQVWCLTASRGKEKILAELSKHPLPNVHFHFVEVADWVDWAYRYEPGVYLHYLVWQHNAYQLAKRLDRDVNFDLIHHATYGSLQMGTGLWKLDKPLIFGPVGGGQFAPAAFKKYFFTGWNTEVKRRWVSKLLVAFNANVRQTLKKAQVVFVSNQETYDLAKTLQAKNLSMLLDCSLPEDFFPPELPVRVSSDTLRILWVGRLMHRKGLPLVLEALSRVNPSVNFHLTIVGDGPQGALIPGWLEEFDLQDKVTWKGQIPWDQVKSAYLNHDLFMFCSLRDSVGMQLLEAMAYGLPILTLDLHGARQLVSDNAGIRVPAEVPEETAQELTQAVEYFYHHPEIRAQFGKAGYEFAKTQSWPSKMATITKHINTANTETVLNYQNA